MYLKFFVRTAVLLATLVLVTGCRIVIQVPEGGRVEAESGTYVCDEGQTCNFEVSTTDFDETFIAKADAGHVFDGWKKEKRHFCGGRLSPCRLFTTAFDGNSALLDILTSDLDFYLVPQFRPADFYQLEGDIHVAAGSVSDSDVNDIYAPYLSNDYVEYAQLVPNPVTIGGYANIVDAGAPGPSTDVGDLDDFYEVDLVAGQMIALTIAESDAGDLDLYLYNSSGDIIDYSLLTGIFEHLVVPYSGRFFVNVYAYSGASNYTLAIGQDSLTQGTSLPVHPDFDPGEVIIKYREGDIASRIGRGFRARAELQAIDFSPAVDADTRSPGANTSKWRFGDDTLRRKWQTLNYIKSLNQQPEVEFAEPNYRYYHYEITPNDEYFGLQQHYRQINLPQAWEETTGNPDVIVAVIDTGVLLDHPDLQGQLVSGYDFISDPGNAADGDGIDPNPYDAGDGGFAGSSSFHGTHVAGTVAAASNNGTGVSGVAWGSRIMPLRALGVDGGSTYDLLQAIRFAAGIANDSGTVPARPATIINMSLGGAGRSQAIQDAILQARQRGVIVVAAAGNESSDIPSYPAAYEGVISVAAVGPGNNITDYSNFGPFVDVAAPGGDLGVDVDGDGYTDGVLSTAGDDADGFTQHTWEFKQGTSMAAPHVAGVIALMKARSPGITPAGIDRLLREGRLTIDLGDAGRDNLYGWGVIDAYKSVLAAGNPASSAPDVAPVLNITPTELSLNSGAGLLSIGNGGAGFLQINQVSTADSWLLASPLGVDAAGLGQYQVKAIPGALSPGNYASNIRVASSAGNVDIPVFVQVASQEQASSAGIVYALLANELGEVIGDLLLTPSNGVYPYRFEGVKEGVYTLVVGSDMDNDFYICDAGEACGAYNTIAYPEPLVLDRNRSGVNFSVGFDASFNTVQQAGTGATDVSAEQLFKRPRQALAR